MVHACTMATYRDATPRSFRVWGNCGTASHVELPNLTIQTPPSSPSDRRGTVPSTLWCKWLPLSLLFARTRQQKASPEQNQSHPIWPSTSNTILATSLATCQRDPFEGNSESIEQLWRCQFEPELSCGEERRLRAEEGIERRGAGEEEGRR